jgi:hypothetical protein
MKFSENTPPRRFSVGLGEPLTIADCGRLELAPDEQVTFVTPSGAEYDLTAKDWGFYATPSLNGRLARFGLRAVLVRNRLGQYYVLLVERDREESFAAYLESERLEVMTWLDSAAALDGLAVALGKEPHGA